MTQTNRAGRCQVLVWSRSGQATGVGVRVICKVMKIVVGSTHMVRLDGLTARLARRPLGVPGGH